MADCLLLKLADKLEALEKRVRLLEAELQEARTLVADARLAVEAERDDGFLLAETAASASSARSSAAVGSAPNPTPSVTSLKKRFYTVIAARPSTPGVQPGVVGIYNCFAAYANQVVEARSYPFVNRRGPLDFHKSTISSGFARVSEAEAYWKEYFPDDAPVRHW